MALYMDKQNGFNQDELGKLDDITPFGRTFIKADSNPAYSDLAYHLDHRDCRDQGDQLDFRICNAKGIGCCAHSNE